MASTSVTPPTVLIIGNNDAARGRIDDSYTIRAADLENSNITARISNVPFRQVKLQMPVGEVFVNNERVIGFRSLIVLSDKTEISLESDRRVNGDPFQKYGLYRRDVYVNSYSPVELSSTLLQDRRHWVDSIGRTNLRKLRHLVEVNGAAHDKFSLEIEKYASKNHDFLTESQKKLFALGDSIKNALKDEIEGKISDFQKQYKKMMIMDEAKRKEIDELEKLRDDLNFNISQLNASLGERDATTSKQKEEIEKLLNLATSQAEKFSEKNQTILDLLEIQEAQQLKLLTLSDQRTRDIEALKDEISRQRLDGPPVEENELGITIVIGNDFEHVLDDDGGGGDDGAPDGPPPGSKKVATPAIEARRSREGAGDKGGAPRGLFGSGPTPRGSKKNTIEPPSKSGGGDKGGASGGDGTESKLLDSKLFKRPHFPSAGTGSKSLDRGLFKRPYFPSDEEIRKFHEDAESDDSGGFSEDINEPRAILYFIASTLGSGPNASSATTIKNNIDEKMGQGRKFTIQYLEKGEVQKALAKFNLRMGKIIKPENIKITLKATQMNLNQGIGFFIKGASQGALTFVYKDKQNRLVSYNFILRQTTNEPGIEYYVKALENSEFFFAVGRQKPSTVQAFIGGVPGFNDDEAGYIEKPQPATYGHNVNAEYIFDTGKSMDNVRVIDRLIYAVGANQYFELQAGQVPKAETFLLPYSNYLFNGSRWKLRL